MSLMNQYPPPNALSSNTQKPHTSSSISRSINESDSNGISPQSIPRRKRTRIYSQSKSTAYTSCQSNQESLNQGNSNSRKNYVAKFTSKKQFPQHLKSYLKLDRELKRCLPNCTIFNAYINQNNDLIIKTDS